MVLKYHETSSSLGVNCDPFISRTSTSIFHLRGLFFPCNCSFLNVWFFYLQEYISRDNLLLLEIGSLLKGHSILVPRAYDPSGLRQESRALGATILK